mgnify:FL=1|jgi:hypothetical protein
MKNKILKQLFVVIFITMLFLGTVVQTFAVETYYQDSKNKSFYASDENKVDTIFQTKLNDITRPFEWLMNTQTFVVFKETKDKDGKDFIKGYYNAPNSQTYIKNLALSDISDGYTDTTYDVNEHQWIVKVGKDAENENVITKYGFHIPSYPYMGEYPRIRMDFSEVAPTGVLKKFWRGVKSLFGGSFVKAPNSDEYKTLLYYNKSYTDNDQDVLDFFKKYYLEYFERAISTKEFKSAKSLINSSFSTEAVESAETNADSIEAQLNANSEARAEFLTKLSDEQAFQYPEVQKAFKKYLKEFKGDIKSYVGKKPDNTYATYAKLKPHFVSETNVQGLTVFNPKANITSDEYSNKAKALIDEQKANEETVKNADRFKEKLENDAANLPKDKIAYTQCLIFSDNDNCTSKKYGDETSLAVMNVYAYSGIYKKTAQYTHKDKELSEDDARILLQELQTYCGPYYQEVVTNMVSLMRQTAEAKGVKIALKTQTDAREMPYDIEQMMQADRETFGIIDPRVERFKSHVTGYAVSNLSLDLGKNKTIYIMPQRALLSVSGTLCEMAVFFQQISNFQFFEDAGLSPTKLWESGVVTLITLLIIVYTLIKLVGAVIGFIRGNGKPVKQILIIALIAFLEIGFVTMMTVKPDKTWEVIKKPIVTAIDLGETGATYTVDKDIKSLFGDDAASRAEVIKYLPYLDVWGQFNTGYGLFSDAQKIDKERDAQELNAYKDVKIANKPIQQYSVLLADSFSYYGQSTSISHSFKDTDGKVYNGKVINNNAYRVVDHFMAPKITKEIVTKDGKQGVQVKVKANLYYNGEYQKGFINLLPKFLINVFNFYTSLIKFCIFIWFWYKLYIFVVSILLDRTKGWVKILTSTFGPLLGMIILSYISTVMLILLMQMTNSLMALIAVFGCFYIYNKILTTWETKYEDTFPATVKPIVYIFNLKQKIREIKSRMASEAYREEMRSTNFDATDEDLDNIYVMYDKLYTETGERRYSDDRMYTPFIEKLKTEQENGTRLTYAMQVAIEKYEEYLKNKKEE